MQYDALRANLENTAACFTASSSAVSHWGMSMPNWLPEPALRALPALLPCRNSRTALGSLMLSALPLAPGSLLLLAGLLVCSGCSAGVAAPSPKKSASSSVAFPAVFELNSDAVFSFQGPSKSVHACNSRLTHSLAAMRTLGL